MANSNGYALGDISGPSSDRSFSRRSSALGRDAQNPTPFTGPDHGVPENHPYDPSSAHLSSDTTSQRRPHGSDLIAEWGWEIAAWLLAAVSLVALLIVFGTYSGNPLSQWRSGITPSTVVQILSQFGQTALLAPVTSCICQSMWLWLKKASKEMQPMDQSDKLPQLIAMQWYDDGSLLVWLGTINTFLIILFGTFAQQTLQLPLQEHNGRFPGLVWRSLQYRAGQPAVQFKTNTLVRFYTIYVPDLNVWDTLDYVDDHKEELIALETTLSLCLYSYNTTTTYGVTNTKQVGKEINLNWQTGTGLQPDKKTSFETVKTTGGSDTFWMSRLNVDSFNKYLSIQIFQGSARYRPATVDGGGNSTSSDAVRVVADSIYGSPPGLRGLSATMDNLAVSMTNGLRNTSDVPNTISGTSTRFDVYIQIEWGWMAVPIAAVILSLVFLLLTISMSRRNRIPAWKSSPLALMYGVEAELRKELGRLGRPLDMEAEARGTEIRLEAEGGRWQIAKAM
ncbi:MAG: hypothetical protein Q9212_004696 [Teloschistes hypoglaucus]